MPKTLLLADDSVVIQKLVGLSFANEDVDLSTTDNGDDAIAKARELKPDLILADVVMPGKNGYEVCEAVKADPQLRHIPVLLLTGTFEAFDENRARNAGSDGHITKPFEAQALVERVTDLLARAPAASQLATTAPNLDGPGVTRLRTTELSEDSFEFFDDGVQSLADSSPSLRGAAAPPPLAAQRSPLSDAPPAAGGLPPLVTLTDDLSADPEPLMPDKPHASTAPIDDLAFDTDDFSPAFGEAATTVQLDQPDAAVQTATAIDPDDLVMDDDPSWNADLEIGPGPVRDASPDATQIVDDLLFQSDPALTARPRPVDLDARVATDTAPPANAPTRSTPAAAAPPAPSAAPQAPPGIKPPALPVSPPAVPPAWPAPEATPSARSPQARPPASVVSGGNHSSDSIAFGDGSQQRRQPDPMQTMLADDLFGDAPPAAATPIPADLDLEIDRTREAPSDGLIDDFDVSSSDLEQSIPEMAALDLSRPDDDFQVADGLLVGASARPEPAAATPAAMPAPAMSVEQPHAGGPDLTPMMRERVHETLERVAWEAFADLSDTVVKQVVAKVEQVAWEVIPQMAESIIREEIRRMKGETDE